MSNTKVDREDLHRRISEALNVWVTEMTGGSNGSFDDVRIPLEWSSVANAVRLLKMMPWPEVTRFSAPPPHPGRGWMVVPNWDNPALNAVDEELGTAIVLAFLTWFETLSEEEKEKVRHAAYR